MKTFKLIIATLLVSVIAFGAQAQNKKKVVEATFTTSAQCGMCKDRIEKVLAYEKGIISADLNVETKVLTVKYKANKTNEAKIKEAVSKAGYDIDDIKADPEAYKKLPACCKKDGGHGGEAHHGHKGCSHGH